MHNERIKSMNEGIKYGNRIKTWIISRKRTRMRLNQILRSKVERSASGFQAETMMNSQESKKEKKIVKRLFIVKKSNRSKTKPLKV